MYKLFQLINYSYSKAPEILQYFKDVAEKYELLRYVKLNHQITRAEWNETSSQWIISVQDLITGESFEDAADIFVNGGGILKYASSTAKHTYC